MTNGAQHATPCPLPSIASKEALLTSRVGDIPLAIRPTKLAHYLRDPNPSYIWAKLGRCDNHRVAPLNTCLANINASPPTPAPTSTNVCYDHALSKEAEPPMRAKPSARHTPGMNAS